MKKFLLLGILSFLYISGLLAQNVIKGGNMENESDWTVIDVGSAYDPSEVIFNYTADYPSKGKGGCLSIAASGVTRNFIYQPIKLLRGHTYYLSCALKNASDENVSNYWLEINLVKREPILVGEGTSSDFGVGKYEYQLGMHYWRSIGTTSYDRIPTGYDGLMEKTLPFDWKGVLVGGKDSVITNPRNPNFIGKHGDSIIFTIADTVDTEDWYLLIKAGAFMTAGASEPVYHWLLDELILWDMAEPLPRETMVQNTTHSKVFEIFPNPVTNGTLSVSYSGTYPLQYCIYDVTGKILQKGNTLNRSIQLNNISTGMYLLRISNGKHSEITKIFVK